jgi:hypothetical protein
MNIRSTAFRTFSSSSTNNTVSAIDFLLEEGEKGTPPVDGKEQAIGPDPSSLRCHWVR